MSNRPVLPSSLQEIQQSLGQQTAILLLKHFGGTRIYIPKRLNVTHVLHVKLGEIATTLVRLYGGETLTIPRAVACIKHRRNREICKLFDNGLAVGKLARLFHLTERQITTILKQS